MSDKLILGYWPFGGLAQTLRYILALGDLEWHDKHYTDREQWTNKDKQGLGLKFPNLPYLIDGDIKITESSAILRYLPKRIGKPELLGKNISDQAEVDTFLGVLQDIGNIFSSFRTTNPNWKEEKERQVLYQKLLPKLSLIEKNSGQNYAIGYLTVVDLRLADLVTLYQKLFPEHIKGFKRLHAIQTNVFEQPQIKKYRQTGVTELFPASFGI